MFTTIEHVKEVTGYDVDLATITKAQYVIMAYIGRIETDVTDPTDKSILARATAYQSAYMKDNPARTFEQVALTQIAQFGQSMTLRTDGVTPWVAPMAVIACQRLSWKRMRSIKTGSLWATPAPVEGWETE